MTILEAARDPKLFGPFFPRHSWRSWFAFLAALFGLPLDEVDLAAFRRHTGRQTPPTEAFREAWLVVGRRGGKSRIAALVAVFLAAFVDWSPYLARGEHGTIALIAADRKQARTLLRYIKAFLEEIPMLAELVVNSSAEGIELKGGVHIEIHTASFRSARGYTLLAVIGDEVAFWRDSEGSENAKEVIRALRPGLATIPGGLLLCISSPYARRGVLWQQYERYYGKDDSATLVWQADTRSMNPGLPQKIVDDAYAEDPASAAAEYGAEFRKDVEEFVDLELVSGLVASDRYELAPVAGRQYVAFVDPAGGSGQDSMTLAIAHRDDGRMVLDAIREIRPPFSPEAAVADFAALLESYSVYWVTGDRYAGEWPRERFQTEGIGYQISERNRSEIYRDLLPLLNSQAVELLDNERLVRQLVDLERRTGFAGIDRIDHAPGKHDDVINAAAGALVCAGRVRSVFEVV